MNAPKFKNGQEVVCIAKEEGWEIIKGSKPIIRPKRNEIYTVRKTICYRGFCWISLMEFPEEYVFDQNCFEPVVRIDELKEILEQQPEEATI